MPSFVTLMLYIYYVVMLSSLGVGIWRSHYLQNRLQVVYYLVWVRVIGEIITVALAAFYIQNHFVINLQSLVEFCLISLVYYHLFPNQWIRRGIIAFTALVVLDSLIRFIQIEQFLRFNNYTHTFTSFVVIGMVLLYFYQLVHQPQPSSLLKFPMFWVSAGILLYYAGNFFYFLYGEQILFSLDVSKIQLLFIYRVASAIYHLFLLIAFVFSKQYVQQQAVKRLSV
ncbi:MAG: hypothetical protein U0Y10_23490 [Spirosomataceae bacterium]